MSDYCRKIFTKIKLQFTQIYFKIMDFIEMLKSIDNNISFCEKWSKVNMLKQTEAKNIIRNIFFKISGLKQITYYIN